MGPTESEQRNGVDKGRREPTVRSVQRAARIMLALLRAAPRGMRVSELSRELGLHKTTVVRLLRTLCGIDLLRRDDRTDCYVWEPLTWVTVLSNIRSLLSPVEGVQIVLRDLAKAADEMVILAYPDLMARQMGITAYALPERATGVDPGLWRASPMHCSAAGKAYLAGKSGPDLEAWARAGLAPATRRSVTSIEMLIRQVMSAKTQGYAVAVEECAIGAAEVGVPVRDDDGNVVAGLQVCARAEGATEGNTQRWVELLADASTKVTAVLYALGTGEAYFRNQRDELRRAGGNAESGQPERRRRPHHVV